MNDSNNRVLDYPFFFKNIFRLLYAKSIQRMIIKDDDFIKSVDQYINMSASNLRYCDHVATLGKAVQLLASVSLNLVQCWFSWRGVSRSL